MLRAPKCIHGTVMAAAMTTLLSVSAIAQTTATFDAEAYFKGRTLELVIPLRAGGTVDLIARYFAAEFPKFLPGQPRIQPRNVTPRIAGANYMSKSKPDGLTFGLVSNVLYQDQFHKSATFDVAQFRYIGAPNSIEGAWFVRGELPYKNIVDAKGGKTPIRITVMPEASAMTAFDVAPLLLAEAFDLPLQAIPISDTATAVQFQMLERNETDGISRGIVYYHLPNTRPGWITKNVVKPFAFVGQPGVKMWPAKEEGPVAPNVTDLITDPELKEAWESTVLPVVPLWAPFFLPPGTPDHLVEVYREAFRKAFEDPEFRKGYEKIDGVEVRPISGAEAQQKVEHYAKLTNAYQPKYEAILNRLYKKYTDAHRNR
jgi:tripartite-type tricarboxylate transporter receptor subunit TctC